MFDRFTTRSKHMMNLARSESQRFNHAHLGTEHMLLGMLADEDGGVGMRTVEALGVDRQRLRDAVNAELNSVTTSGLKGQLPFTPGARHALESAMTAAGDLGHNYIGTEHLLLGLIKDDGIAGRVLQRLGVDYDAARAQLVSLLAQSDATAGNRFENPMRTSSPKTAQARAAADHAMRLATLRFALRELREIGERAAADEVERVIRKLENGPA